MRPIRLKIKESRKRGTWEETTSKWRRRAAPPRRDWVMQNHLASEHIHHRSKPQAMEEEVSFGYAEPLYNARFLAAVVV
jgi:hypothetical protein